MSGFNPDIGSALAAVSASSRHSKSAYSDIKTTPLKRFCIRQNLGISASEIRGGER